MKDSYVSLRINKKLKDNLHKIFYENGLTISEGIRLVYNKIEEDPETFFYNITESSEINQKK